MDKFTANWNVQKIYLLEGTNLQLDPEYKSPYYFVTTNDDVVLSSPLPLASAKKYAVQLVLKHPELYLKQ